MQSLLGGGNTMRGQMTWGALMLLAAFVGLGPSVSAVEAVDVQGTWDGTVVCTAYQEGHPPARVTPPNQPIKIRITQTGTGLAISTDVLNNFAAVESDDGVHTTRGVIGGSVCQNGFVAAGVFGTVSRIATGAGGAMTIDVNGAAAPFGPIKCHVMAKRTSAVDPAVPLCP
jgi:hypothetical protein